MAEGQPRYQDFPPPEAFDRQKLKESIQEHGVLEPIVVDEGGHTLDGHIRKAICDELGIPCPERSIPGLTDDQKRLYAVHINAARRHLSIEQRRQVWDDYQQLIRARLSADPTRSDRDIATELSTDHKTVAKQRRTLQDGGDIPTSSYEPTLGSRSLEDEHSINVADHRNEVWFELTIGYPVPSDKIRMRGDKPYPQASERVEWFSDRLYLIAEAPEDAIAFDKVIDEIWHRVKKEIRARPLETMKHMAVVL